jgi:hypothetical protein
MRLPYRHELFVDREEEIRAILDIVALLLAGKVLDSQQRVIHLVGPANMGKSWLLQECNYRLDKDPKIVSLYMNLENFAKPSKAEDFIKGVLRYVDSEASSSLKINSPFIKNADGSIDTYAYAEWVIGIIEQVQAEKVMVLFLDEINLLSGERLNLLQSLEDYFLATILNMPNLVCVFAGRYLATGWKAFDLRPQKGTLQRGQGKIMNLPLFDLERTVQQLQKRNPNSEHLAEKILELSNGSPGNNDILLGQATGNPLEIKDDLIAIHACNQELVEMIENLQLPKGPAGDLWSALEALSVVQDFDRDEEMPVLLDAHRKLQGKLDRRQLDLLFDTLRDLNIGPGRLIGINLQNGTYVIDELIRTTLERELILRDKKLWQVLQCAAMKMYQRWADEYMSIIFAEKADYHRTRLAQAGFDPADCEVEIQKVVS